MAGKTKSEKRAPSAKPAGKRSRRKAETGDAELISALNHVLRRDILRLMHSSAEARSPVDISEELDQPLAGVSYHVQILHRLSWRIGGVGWFSWADDPGANCQFCDSSGLLTAKREAKPSWYAFNSWTGGDAAIVPRAKLERR